MKKKNKWLDKFKTDKKDEPTGKTKEPSDPKAAARLRFKLMIAKAQAKRKARGK